MPPKKTLLQCYQQLPLVYSCSGCSNAAQLANALAVRLDREQKAEMSCIAGVGADVPSFIKMAQDRASILVLDGCPIHCARRSLARHAIVPTEHIDLSKHGVKKRWHEDVDTEELEWLWRHAVLPAVEHLMWEENQAQKNTG